MLQLDDVQPTLAEFTFRNERMRLPEPLGHLSLEVASIVSGFYQSLEERLISSLVCRIAFVHDLRLRDRPSIPQNREWSSESRTVHEREQRI